MSQPFITSLRSWLWAFYFLEVSFQESLKVVVNSVQRTGSVSWTNVVCVVSVRVVRCVSWVSTQLSTMGPRMYERAVSMQPKGTIMAGWVLLLSL